jgi:hypothetical protein
MLILSAAMIRDAPCFPFVRKPQATYTEALIDLAMRGGAWPKKIEAMRQWRTLRCSIHAVASTVHAVIGTNARHICANFAHVH